MEIARIPREKQLFAASSSHKKAKQIWIVGTQLSRVENWHFSFNAYPLDLGLMRCAFFAAPTSIFQPGSVLARF